LDAGLRAAILRADGSSLYIDVEYGPHESYRKIFKIEAIGCMITDSTR
jgi:hypothetical protein